jgi:ABC-type branched-subunit amino acid transport system substrate-binding protein
VSTTQLNTGGFNLASGLSGFAIGAAATVLAFVAINPSASGTPTNAADAGVLTIPGVSGGLSTSSLPQVGQTATLSNGTRVTRLAGGQLRVTDTAGHTRTVVIGGSAGTASKTIGGSAGTSSQTIAGQDGTSSQTIAGSDGNEGSAGAASGSTEGGAAGSGSASGSGQAGSGSGSAGGACSGGATDTGVTASSVKLGATVAESGIAQAFLGQARQGIEAYKNRVNSKGGVCGRTLNIKYVDDGWDAQTGKSDLENLINDEKVFALAVAPSSEGVNSASAAGTFAKSGVPVVGTDGLDASQYKDPYIWPVASATVTLLHVMMQKAYDDGARNPAIVYDNEYKFGTEGANAFEKAYERLAPGKQIPGFGKTCGSNSRFCGISAGTGQYGNQVSIINNACKAHDGLQACDYLVLLMEPDTAEQWMATPGAPTAAQFGKAGMGAAQPLFTYSFGTTCGDKCNGMQVWTGYNPPLEQFAGTAGVKQYVNDLHGQNSSADAYNQFTEGSYLGMQLLVDAMGRVGGDLTRESLKAALDATSLDTGLSASPATWSAGSHWAVGGAQGFTMQSSNGFSGWRAATPFTADPWLGKDFG